MDKLNYNEAVNFIRNNFDSSLELMSLMNKYKSGSRFPSLGDIDRIINVNRDMLMSITGEVINKSLDIFNEGKEQLDLEFWISQNYPTEVDLRELIDLYSEGFQVQDIKDHLIITNNYDAICQYYFDTYHPEDTLIENGNKEIKTFSMEDHDYLRFESDITQLQHFISIFIQDLKYAHWVTYGSTFVGMHELYQEMYENLEELQDELIETVLSIDRNLVCHPSASISVENDLNLFVGKDFIQCTLEKLAGLEVKVMIVNHTFVQPIKDKLIEFLNKYVYKFKAITTSDDISENLEHKLGAFCNQSQRNILTKLIKSIK